MSREDKPDNPGGESSPEVLERYGRKSGTARKGEKPRFWRRMVGWVAPTAGTEGEQEADGDPPAGELAVKLLLPNGGTLVLRLASSGELSDGLLELPLASPPDNDPEVLRLLSTASSRAAVSEAVAEELVLEALDPVGGAPADDLDLPILKPVDTEDFSLPLPSSAETSAGESDVAIPIHLGTPMQTPAAPVTPRPAQRRPERPTAEVAPPPELRYPTGLVADGAAGPSRGGAARQMFGDSQEDTLTNLMGTGGVRPAPAVERQPAAWESDPTPRVDPHGAVGSSPPDPRTTTANSIKAVTLAAAARRAAGQPSEERLDFGGQAAHAPAAPAPAAPAATAHPHQGTSSVVGIDFGTTYSSVAVMHGGLVVIPDEAGEPQIPSVVSFPGPGIVLVGAEARQRMAGEAQWTVASPKRLLARLFKDPQVTQRIGGLALRTFAGSDKFVRFEAHGQIYSVPDICTLILKELRERASRFLGIAVSKAVFTVPVGFGTLQRSALEIAARQAGLEIVGILTEPSAGLLSHGFRGRKGLVAVYDFGGGTFDFSLLRIAETAFQVICAGGDPWLGGDDFDLVLANHLADRFWSDSGVDLRSRAVEWQALIFACEAAKRELSGKSAAEVRLDDLLHTARGMVGLRYTVSLQDFNGLIAHLLEQSVAVMDKVLKQANIDPRQIDAVVMTGGSSLIPAVRESVARYYGKQPVIGDPNLAVVKGAALRAAEISGEAMADTAMGGRTLREVAGRTIGAGLKGGRPQVLFERNTPLPAEAQVAFPTEEDHQTEMVVALYEAATDRLEEGRTIGHLRFKGLRPAPAGQEQIAFSFSLDEDGILHVTALINGKEYSRTIQLS